jgi:HAD superfamily hydrolase (TIGR01509 family)
LLVASRIDAVIFDCDGTLVDSETLGPAVLFDCLCERGVSRDLLDVRQVRGRNLVDYLAEIEAVCGVSLPEHIVLPDYRSRLSDAFRGRLQPIAGARELVDAVSRRVPVAVASSAAKEKIVMSLSFTGLESFFTGRIYSSYDIRSWKPEPGLFLHVAKELGVAPERCAVVEDSTPGVTAGVAAGMYVFALETDGVDLPALAGVHRAPSLASIADRLLPLLRHP